MGSVSFEHKELRNKANTYRRIRDCIDGTDAVKARREVYLPQPNAADVSEENRARYEAYLRRAVFYNVVHNTLSGLVGQLFLRDPVIEVSSLLDPVVADANGAGVSLVQLAKRATDYVLAYGRAGLLTDYPGTESGATRAQLDRGEVRPTINVYAPWDIINWRTTQRGARVLLSLVVLAETYEDNTDAFETREVKQWRVLQLVDDVYRVALYRADGRMSGALVPGYPVVPRKADGSTFDEIPFSFVGVTNNDALVDIPPLGDLAALNLAHYRNSADYEESVFMVGQPTPYFSGLTVDWVERVLKGRVELGARAAVALPEGGAAGLLQAEPNTLAFEAMEQKERQMVALGAKLVQQQTVQRTATEAGLESAAETSVLASAAKNISAAFVAGLRWCCAFLGVAEEPLFRLNDEFTLSKLSGDELSKIIATWQAGAISFSEMREALRRNGIARQDDEEARAEIDADQTAAIEHEAAMGEALNVGNNGDNT